MTTQPTTPQDFSFANATEALDELWNALPKSKRAEFLVNLNEVAVVLTVAAARLGVVRDSAEWRTTVSKLGPKYTAGVKED